MSDATHPRRPSNTGLKVATALIGLAGLVTLIVVWINAGPRNAAQQQKPAPPPNWPAGPSLMQRLAQVELGMTVEEVERLMGPGEKTEGRNGERLQWQEKTSGATMTHYVTYKDGKVTGKGTELR